MKLGNGVDGDLWTRDMIRGESFGKIQHYDGTSGGSTSGKGCVQ